MATLTFETEYDASIGYWYAGIPEGGTITQAGDKWELELPDTVDLSRFEGDQWLDRAKALYENPRNAISSQATVNRRPAKTRKRRPLSNTAKEILFGALLGAFATSVLIFLYIKAFV